MASHLHVRFAALVNAHEVLKEMRGSRKRQLITKGCRVPQSTMRRVLIFGAPFDSDFCNGIGTKLPSGDVRYSVAMGEKRTCTVHGRTDANDPSRTSIAIGGKESLSSEP